MFQLLAMLPTIFSAMNTASELVDAGKGVYEAVTGKPSTATTPQELQTEVEVMPADQLQAWTEKMAANLKMYEAQTDRLRNEQGDITDTMIDKLGPEAAAEIAKERMTTRPWTVRKMVHYLMLPFYITCVDVVMAILNVFIHFANAVTEIDLPDLTYIGSTFLDTDSTYATMYEAGVGWAASIVLGYMTLREVGKAGGPKKALASTIASAADGIKSLVGVFKK